MLSMVSTYVYHNLVIDLFSLVCVCVCCGVGGISVIVYVCFGFSLCLMCVLCFGLYSVGVNVYILCDVFVCYGTCV